MLRGLFRWGREGIKEAIWVFNRVGLSLRGDGSKITHTPFSLPIPNILCQNFRMNRLLILSILLLTLLAGTPAFSADFRNCEREYKNKNYHTAIRLCRPFAEQGNPLAQHKMGMMYDHGRGIPPDTKTAVKWHRLAAEQGNTDAQNNLGGMYATGQGVIQDYVRSHMWWSIAATSGSKGASKNRDKVAGMMTPAQIAEAQKLARECVRKKYKGC
jgi:TPR repeat protein